jgi:hypothetical protein
VEIDSSKFLGAFSFEDNGSCVYATEWEMAPSCDVQNPFTSKHQAVQDAYLCTQFDHYLQGIPHLKQNKYSGWDVTKGEYRH